MLAKFLQRLAKKKEAKEQEAKIPYVDSRRVTKTGKVRARAGEQRQERGWFGVDEAITELPELSKSAEKVYRYLSRIADKDGYCFPFYKTIATRCSISESTVAKAIKELDQKGLVTKRARRVSRRGGSSNLYQVRKIVGHRPGRRNAKQ